MTEASALGIFTDILPANRISSDADEMTPFLAGWRGMKRGRADLVLLPRSVEEVTAIVRTAAEHRIAIVPQGGNTGLVGGSVPEPDAARGTVVLSLRRMNRILSVDSKGLSMEVEAGAILQHVHEAAEAEGVRFPLSLGSKGSATIGGLVSTNAGGTQALRFGPMRSLVLGLEAVLADGSRIDQLRGLRKDNTGYDIKQLLIGGEGTLGIVTRVSLRLVPQDRERTASWIGLDSIGQALSLLGRLRRDLGEGIESFELVGEQAMELVERHATDVRFPLSGRHPYYVLAETACGHERLEALLAAALEAGEIADAAVAMTGAQSDDFWKIRELVPIAEKAEGGAVKNDISVAVEDVPAFVQEAMAMFRTRYATARPIMFGHLGDGNLHFNLRPPAGEGTDWLNGPGEEARHALHDIIRRYRGSISAEHGVGTLKKTELARLGDPGKLAAIRLVKQALDPHGIMNPGKMIDTA